MVEIFRLLRPFFPVIALSSQVAHGAAPRLPAGVISVSVEKDAAAYALPAEAETGEVIVYLHGHCGDPLAGLRSFPEAARKVGTMISVQGDIPCGGRAGKRRWSTDAERIQGRVDAAIAATSRQLGRELSPQKLTLVGYSEGALRAELLAGAFPGRYPRVILGGEPRAPRPDHFRGAQAVATLAGQLDDQRAMREGADALLRAGIPARFFLLPKARHGQYGPEGNRVLGEAFAWLLSPAR